MSKILEGRIKSVLFRLERILYFFSLLICCVSRSEEHLVRFLGIFHSRNIAILVQSSQHFAFIILPSVLSFASSQSKCVFMIFFVWNTCSEQRPVFFRLFNLKLLTFLFRYCLGVFVVRIKLKRPWFIKGNHVFLSLSQPDPWLVVAHISYSISR